MKLAKKFKGEIISADSRQVYKGLDIGSGKITRAEMKGVPHHLLDVADPKKAFSVSKYKELAETERKFIEERNRLPVVVGGTGFYIDALAGTVGFPDVPPNPKLREKLYKKTLTQLFGLLLKKDPRRAKTVDPNNKVRIVRALEIIEAIGKVPKIKSKAKDDFIYIGLLPDDLDERIRLRIKKRMPGMIAEAKKLRKDGLTYKRMHELGLEYRYLGLFLQGKLDKKQMEQELFFAIRQYAKRQMAWFKRNKKIKWFKPSEYKDILKHIQTHLNP